MSRYAVLPLLAGACLPICSFVGAFAAYGEPSAGQGSNASAILTEGKESPLDGKSIVGRVYKAGEENASFQRVEAVIHHEDGVAGDVEAAAKGPMPHFEFDSKGVLGDALLVIMPEDQTDPTVRKYLGNCVQSPLRQKGRRYFCVGRHGRDVLVVDALGAPIPDAVVEFRLKGFSGQKSTTVRYGSWRTNAEGHVELPEVWEFLIVDEVLVSQPAYGTASITNSNFKDRIDTPLVAQGTEGWERALRGRVVDAEDRPIETVVVSVDCVTPPAGVSVQLYPPAVVLTDAKGCFALLAGNSKLPAHSLYRYKVVPPDSAACVLRRSEASNDAETVIRLERGSFHTFAFKDGSGQAIDRNKWCCTSITRKGTGFVFDDDEVRSGTFLADGTYSASFYYVTERKAATDHGSKVESSTSGPVTFPDVEVAGSSPREVVFSLSRVPRLVIRGELLNAKTQEPMEGVLVSTKGLLPKALRPEEQDWLGPLVSDDNSACGQDSVFTRTGKGGHFELALMPGQEIQDLRLWARNFLPYTYRTSGKKPEADGVLDLEKIPMFPAGMLSFQVNSANTDEEYFAICAIEERAPSLCALPLWDRELSGLMSLPYCLMENNLHRVNRLEHVYIPAGGAASVELRSFPRSARFLVMPHQFTLAQGQVLSLDPLTFPPEVRVPVQVVDERGSPREGVPVRLTIDKFSDAPVYTDAQGMAMIALSPDSTGTLSIVPKTGNGTGPAIVTCPFSMHGEVPDKGPYVLVLPSQEAPRVFGNMTNSDSDMSPHPLVLPSQDAPQESEDLPKMDFPGQPKLRLHGLF